MTSMDTVSDVTSQNPHRGIQQADDEDMFVGKLESHNFKNVIRIIKSIYNNRKMAFIHINQIGLKIVIQELGNFQMTAYVRKEVFQFFKCIGKEIYFQISLDILLNCLQIFVEVAGEATCGQFSYKGDGYPLTVQLEQMGYFTQCDIKTINVPVFTELQFHAEELLSRIICKSECIRDCLNGLLAFPSPSLEVQVTKNAPYFLMRIVSDNVESEITISKDSDYVEGFTCSQNTMFSYRTSLIKSVMKSLSISEKTSIRIDKAGVMALQFMIRDEEDVISFVEICCVPEQEIPDDD